jgi:transporter family-2 protein
MNPSILAIALVILAGGATALQGPTNARLATAVGSPVNAAFVSFSVGAVALAVLAVMFQTRPDWGATRALPWYGWMGGLYGVGFVIAAAWSVPRLGAALTVTLMVMGQVLMSLLVDHFGALGVPQQPMSMGRLAGVTLIVAGVLLVRRF